ncbi:YjiH family protein [Aquibacillus koreensis]|uniref:YjiH family protein n=1 Tax=Aquibacillus koreensis TaxID=279446 RepID=A0A9X3WN89_9BACI|nr:YjiH family protein [Aquibacillus koreensis]MCT2536904.1 YjiH family protein [Aquibacillus koreensis]MDC3421965.1 YjiH family protein [Aquibacillus koreensis]
MIPISSNGEITIPVAWMANKLEGFISPIIPETMTIILVIVAFVTFWATILKPRWITAHHFLTTIFVVHPAWVIVRIVGAILAIMTLLELGPEWVWSDATGGLLLFELIPLLFTIFLFAGIFLPLLLNFGLVELFGTLLDKVMKPLFTLPGRSSVDCLASWMGDGTIGVVLTNNQYEQGHYTKREAAVISTTFSVVSITFSIVILSQLKLQALFVPYYFTIVLAGFVAALILPRIPPLSRKPNTYVVEQTEKKQELPVKRRTEFRFALSKALAQAKRNEGFQDTLKSGLKNVLDMWFGVIPVVMAIGTIAVIIAETTPVFALIGTPFVPILQLLQVPEATEAAQTMVIGFADMFLPALLGSGIESEFTRFVIACVSVTQLIYMSEVGGILLASKIPVRFIDLVIIFLLRTMITLPIIALVAHIIF